MGELVRFDPPHGGQLAPVGLDLVGAILATLNARTARTYISDYRDFAAFLGAPGPAEAIDALIGMGPGEANRTALAYRVHLADRKLAPGTVARRLVALRSACKAARRVGRIGWGLDVPGPKPEPYRDTRGPGRDGWRRMLDVAKAAATDPKGKRDLALIRLLHDQALRRGEAVALDVDNLDLSAGTVAVIGKGKAQAQRITLSRQTREALSDWLAVRPVGSPALFVRLDPGSGFGDPRLTGQSVALVVAAIGKAAGLARVPRPHGLRHQAITQALDSGRDVRDVRKFSRHAKLDTVLIYDDARRDVAGEIGQMIADD
jgi:integrase/recombinase XerC